MTGGEIEFGRERGERGEREGEGERGREGERDQVRESYVVCSRLCLEYLDFAPSPVHPRLFLDVAGIFLCFLLTEHVLCFEPHVRHY